MTGLKRDETSKEREYTAEIFLMSAHLLPPVSFLRKAKRICGVNAFKVTHFLRNLGGTTEVILPSSLFQGRRFIFL